MFQKQIHSWSEIQKGDRVTLKRTRDNELITGVVEKVTLETGTVFTLKLDNRSQELNNIGMVLVEGYHLPESEKLALSDSEILRKAAKIFQKLLMTLKARWLYTMQLMSSMGSK